MGKHTILIGGGAMGSSTAYFLSTMRQDPDDRITVIERDSSYSTASSSLSASSIRQQFSTPVSVKLSQFGWEFMRGCSDGGIAGAAVGLQQRGYLFLGRADQEAVLRQQAEQNRALGVALQEFSPADLARQYPWMHCGDLAYACMATDGEGWFDGYMLQQLYRSRARAGGVQYLNGAVAGFETQANRISAVRLADGSVVKGDVFVNTAGAWSAQLAAQVGVSIPVRARRRTLFVVSCPQPIPHFPILVDTSGIFVRPEQHHFLCALSPQAEHDFDDLPLDPDMDLFETRVWPTLAERIPAFEALRVERAWAGYYEFNTADHNGLVGQIGPDNFYVTTGFSGHGLMHSAGVGRGMAELLTTGAYQSIDLAPLNPHRLQTGELIVEAAVY